MFKSSILHLGCNISFMHHHRDSNALFCRADACFLQAFSSSLPQSTRLSICSKSSSQVITPGVGSGGMKPAHPAQFGYAPTSLHISSQRPASLFCNCARRLRSVASQACCSLFLEPTCSTEDTNGTIARNTAATFMPRDR